MGALKCTAYFKSIEVVFGYKVINSVQLQQIQNQALGHYCNADCNEN